MSWYNNTGDISVSTRIRIARNINKLPFPHKMTKEQIVDFTKQVKEVFKDKEFSFGKLTFINCNDAIKELPSMVERHIISPDFAANYENKAMLLSQDETVSIMLCEEDHIRIQVIFGDENLNKALDIAKEVETVLLENLDIAANQDLGFLTTCPTNLGTGLRASVMLHLPALASFKTISSLADSISKIGFTIRGLYGEGSKAEGALYQISNQVTLGISEIDAINNLKNIVNQIIEREQKAREELDKNILEDTVFRAFALLKGARILSSSELSKLISNIKLGVSMGIINNIPKSLPIELLITTKPYMLQNKHGILTANDRDIIRATTIREQLGEYNLVWNTTLMALQKKEI